MFTALRSVGQHRILRFPVPKRCLATETSLPQAADGRGEETAEEQRQRYNLFLEEKAKEPPNRPQLKIQTNENHGLYAFFRKLPVNSGVSSSLIYETVEPRNKSSTKLGEHPSVLLQFSIPLNSDSHGQAARGTLSSSAESLSRTFILFGTLLSASVIYLRRRPRRQRGWESSRSSPISAKRMHGYVIHFAGDIYTWLNV